ncbi:hypothetical protein evm_014657 [Chilo suppressalis]|nr:hypothetical protein evm_014657 [Chilo suppressalis]
MWNINFLSNNVPVYLQPFTLLATITNPKVFYVTERHGITTIYNNCALYTQVAISIQTRYEDDNGTTENCLGLTAEELEQREVDFLDIAYDDIKPHHYKEAEDPKYYKSEKTGRGPLVEGWRDTQKPIMCCYKVVSVKFEVWGLQTKVEEYVQGAIREILVLGHRQAFAWMDDWYNMTIDDVREYESEMQAKTNIKMKDTIENVEQGEEIKFDSSKPKHSKITKEPRSYSNLRGKVMVLMVLKYIYVFS